MSNFDYAIVRDPKIYKVNVLNAHSDHIMLDGEGKDTLRISLNGLWKFAYADNYGSAVQNFYETDYDCRCWKDITVPSHIQLEGYDVPAYNNIQYPWDGKEDIRPGEIPVQHNPTASYTRYFVMPDNMLNRQTILTFEGVESGFTLWVNGTYVGYHEDSFSAASFDITDRLKKGDNKISVMVFKYTSSSWLEDQDMFRFSGIYRDVWLSVLPEVNVYDLSVKPQIKPDNSGMILFDLEYAGTDKNCTGVYCCIKDMDQTVYEGTFVNGIRSFAVRLDEVHPWSAEDPYLYTAELVFSDRKGSACSSVHQNFGFRTFELNDGLMKFNGRRIVFHGVNRHEFTAVNGRVPDPVQTEKDVRIMKQNNINAVRTSHYMNSGYIYDLCDRYGLYMIAENNMESHGIFQQILMNLLPKEAAIPGDNMDYEGMMLDRLNSTYQTLKNHPSIIIWSLGNESYGGKVIQDMHDWIRKKDPGRLVHYEGIFHDRRYNDSSDMESQMYTSAANVKKFLEEHPQKPMILCEFSHAMGNSLGGFSLYTDLTHEIDRYQGGFIWDFADQAIHTKDCFGKPFNGYGGDFQDRPCDYEFSGDGICDADHKPYAKMQEVKYCYQDIRIEMTRDVIKVHNDFLFTDTNAFEAVLTLSSEGKLCEKTTMDIQVEPGEARIFAVPLKVKEAGEYVLALSFRLKEDTLYAAKGYEIAYAETVFRNETPVPRHEGRFTVVKGGFNIGVHGDNFSVLFNYAKAGLTSYVYGGRELIRTIPRLNFFRAPNANDDGNQMAYEAGMWRNASLYYTAVPMRLKDSSLLDKLFKNPCITESEDHVDIRYTYVLPASEECTVDVVYTVYGDGTVQFALDYDPVRILPAMPEFGMLFGMEPEYNRFRWYGDGPGETYCDRNRSARVSVYESTVHDSMENYLVPQETGNHTHVRYGEVMDEKGRGLRFSCHDAEGMNFSVLPYTPDQMENAKHAYELPRIYQTVIRCSLAQMGVGGDDSWGAKTHAEDLLPNQEKLHFVFEMKGI